MRKTLFVAGALVFASGAHAQTAAELGERLDAALRTIRDLQARIEALEAQRRAQPPAPQPSPQALPQPSPVPTASAPALPEEGKPRIEPYGQAMLDAVYDARRMNPAWQATLRPSQIPVQCPGDPGCGKDGAFAMSVRQSSLGVRAAFPTALGEVKTDLAFDLFGTDGSTSIHWLRAWAELGHWGAGQTDSNFMDLAAFPNIIDYWGPPGMVFVRNPQVRYTSAGGGGTSWSVSLEAPNSIIDTGKLSQVDPSLGAGVTAHNRWPDVVGAVRLERAWGHVRAAALLRRVGFQTATTASGNPAGERSGYGLNLTGVVKATSRDTVSWGLAGGRGMASYMNDGGTDLAPDAGFRAQAVASLGYFAYLGHAWSDKLTSSIGLSQHRQDNTAGQAGNALHAGSYASGNLLYALTTNVLVGGEYLWGRRENKDGSSATDNRFQFSTRVSF